MNIAHLSALLLTLLIYVVLAVAFYGWGLVTARLLGFQKQATTCVTYFVWLGWAFTLLLFQLLYFVLPLTAFVAIPVLAIGAALALPSVLKAYRCNSIRPSIRIPLILGGIIAILFASWIASRSMLPPTNYDSGLYHFNKIRWINSFPIVPGLGNLHGRLAFNHSFFAYVAAVNLYPFFGHGASIANSFLFLLTIATFLESLRPVFNQPALLIESHPFQYIGIVLTLPTLAYLSFYPHFSEGFSSPSPDLTSIFLQLTMMLVFAQALGEWNSGVRDQNARAVLLGLLAVSAVTIKLSNLAFSSVIMVFVLLYARARHAPHLFWRLAIFSAFALSVWCLQSILLSGAPFYPATIGYLPVKWAVPIEQAINEAEYVYGFARKPDQMEWRSALETWHWIVPWIDRLFIVMWVVLPLTITVLTCTITFALCRYYNRGLQLSEWAIVLPSAVGAIYWFFLAPDMRFAHAIFFTLPVGAVVLLFSLIRDTITGRRLLLLLCVAFGVVNIPIFARFARTAPYTSFSLSGWQPAPSIPMEIQTTSSGLPVYTPRTGDQCWDSPLPSTPYFNANLTLIRPGDISSGFTVKHETGSEKNIVTAAPQ
jgi:hypothetical protein